MRRILFVLAVVALMAVPAFAAVLEKRQNNPNPGFAANAFPDGQYEPR